MSLRIAIFFSLVLVGLLAAAWRAHREEQAVIASFAAACVFTRLAAESTSFVELASWILLIDVALLAFWVRVALRSDRYWPLWLCALQLLGTLGHPVMIVEPTMLPITYVFALNAWGWPTLALIWWAILTAAPKRHWLATSAQQERKTRSVTQRR